MNRVTFLFEFQSRKEVEHVLIGKWKTRRSSKLAVVVPNSRVLLKGPQKIGERCGKWIEMEEETELKNHLRWAQIPQGETDSSRYPEMQDRETPHNLFRSILNSLTLHLLQKANSSVLSTAP
ncbi:hypothetical protein H5410_027048 [Solanum commersonii]|uniref:Uncharacterized protein n=1 Tax=Solanum commersonii TaxID=4109 RepID=A0A9J5Z2C2_SOLCO|nr:hypothetical protein H5410_027048 [Solanum commersonii]